MEDQGFKNLFDSIKNELHMEEPAEGHLNRFEEKLLQSKKQEKTMRSLWKYFAIAASIALVFSLGFWQANNSTSNGLELATVSEKMAETQDYFTLAIQHGIEELSKEKDADTEQLINDALTNLKRIENDYEQLKIELKENSTENRIIHAMISNFQQRILVLENVLDQINNVRQLKKEYHETIL